MENSNEASAKMDDGKDINENGEKETATTLEDGIGDGLIEQQSLSSSSSEIQEDKR